jgi:hypothetical protein
MIPVIAELRDTLAHDIPDLRNAACRGRPQLFDVADRHDTQAVGQAKALCASCPGTRRLPCMVVQPAQRGEAVRCGGGPLPRTTHTAAGIRTTAAGTVQPGTCHHLAAGLFGAARPGPQHGGDR